MNHKFKTLIFLYFIVATSFMMSCARVTVHTGINHNEPATAIDYSILDNWAAHPDKEDLSDVVPAVQDDHFNQENDYDVDIFFIHPTTYTDRPKDGSWNADINSEKLNKKTDKSTIQYQASIFNQVGRVYAPRYRQAFIEAFYTRDTIQSRQSIQFAYEDVADAFRYYLENEWNNRPFIIASHSQGTVHATKLIKEFIDGQPLQQKLIVAYLIGMPIEKKIFKNISVCRSPLNTNCFVSWRTYRAGYTPEFSQLGESITVINPLSWNSDKRKIDKSMHKGAILRNFNKRFSEIIEARIHNGMLWVNKPKFPWSFLFTRKNYHIADMNFFYYDIQINAQQRVTAYTSVRSQIRENSVLQGQNRGKPGQNQ